MHRASVLLGTSLFLLTGLFHAADGLNTVKDSECDCFLTNGTQPTFYANHVFFDFRNLPQHARVPDLITSADDSSSASPASSYFTSSLWTGTWQTQSWNNAKGGGHLNGDAHVLRVNSPNNVYIQASDEGHTHLTLRTSRLDEFQSTAEFQTKSSNYLFLSLRVLARTTGAAGGVSAIFTYRDAPKLADIQEAALEVVTRGPRTKVQCTNQPSYADSSGAYDAGVAGRATRNSTLPFAKEWTSWAVYRLDWTPTRSIWFVDGQQVADIEFQVPRDPAAININSWGDGGSWSGNMSVGAESNLQIQWIEIIYNNTDDASGGKARRHASPIPASPITPEASSVAQKRGVKENQCGAVCSIDDSTEIGSASKLWGVKTSIASASPRTWSWIWTLYCSALFSFTVVRIVSPFAHI